jgi:hypothetical protein
MRERTQSSGVADGSQPDVGLPLLRQGMIIVKRHISIIFSREKTVKKSRPIESSACQPFNAVKDQVAPWWAENSKEADASGLANLVTALGNWTASATAPAKG